MAEYMGTFGVRYKSEPHPTGKDADPDGYVLIYATDMNHAIELMQAEYGNAYAFIYPDWNFKTEYHQRGIIATLGEEPVK